MMKENITGSSGEKESAVKSHIPEIECIHERTVEAEYCACTHVGLKRKKNDDFYLALTSDGAAVPGKVTSRSGNIPVNVLGAMFAVADGMGGHPAGDVAARIACNTFRDTYYDLSGYRKLLYSIVGKVFPPLACRFMMTRMERAMEMAHQEICRHECNHEKCQGLGTTLSVLVTLGRLAMIAHVGDSRIYRLRDEQLELLTLDHTFVQDLVDMGEMTRKQADESPMRHVLMQALGQGFDEVFSWCGMIKKGDQFLICSDGLNDMVSDQKISEVMRHAESQEHRCRELVKLALEAGGKDNITLMIVEPC